MDEMNRTSPIKLSASALSAYAACPTRYRLGYEEYIRRGEDKEALRQGTAWHLAIETFTQTMRDEIASGTDPQEAENEAMHVVYTVITEHYRGVVEDSYTFTAEDAELEMTRLFAMFGCYVAYYGTYGEDDLLLLAEELPFEDTIGETAAGTPVVVRGKVDGVAVYQHRGTDVLVNVERKTTTRDIQPTSDYWAGISRNVQVGIYAEAMRGRSLDLPAETVFGVPVPDRKRHMTLYDVVRIPKTKPKMLTQAATAVFLEEGTYYDEPFETHRDGKPIPVEQLPFEVKHGAGDRFAIMETPAMYGARLVYEVMQDPEAYFQRLPISWSNKDLARLRGNLMAYAAAIENHRETGAWPENWASCHSPFSCDYNAICHGTGAGETIRQGVYPEGFVRLTRERKDVPDGETAPEDSTQAPE